MKNTKIILILSALIFPFSAFAHEGHHDDVSEQLAHEDNVSQRFTNEIDPWFTTQDDLESMPDFLETLGCRKPSSAQVKVVNQGNQKRSQFYNYCVSKTGSASWCTQVERPNPGARSTFNCTYGASQPHLLIHPTESTWIYAVTAIQLIQKLSAKGICVSSIYNWWRPEPYNANVGGAAGRHPYGTSVDVRFCSNSDAIKGFDELCKYRKQGTVRALGYYGSTGVHVGVGDRTANTWGRSCR